MPLLTDSTKLSLYNASSKSIALATLDDIFYNYYSNYENDVAVWSEHEEITLYELNLKSNQVALFLLNNGIVKGDFVGVIGHRKAIVVIYILGIIKAGAAYVPIEPSCPDERKNYIIKNSNIKFILNDDAFDTYGMSNFDSYDIKNRNTLDDLAYVIYTSGSTGIPKGVMITHRSACNTILDINERFGISKNDNILCLSSFGFDLSVYDIFGGLSTGATVYIAEDVRDTERLIHILSDKKITFWNSVPAIMSLLVETLEILKSTKKFHLRNILLSGDWIPVALPGKILEYFHNAKVTSLGGATEAAIWSIYYPIDKVDKNWKSIPYGYPLSNQNMYVLNSDLEFCTIGVEGEIYIGGIGVAKGYLNDDVKTCQSFLQHPSLGYIYKTGDYGIFKEEGYIEFLGRKDSQVKINGFRIELGEIDYQISKFNEVKDVISIVRQDKPNESNIVSYFTLKKNIFFAKEILNQWKIQLKKVLPEYMIPSAFVVLDELPLTGNGKVDRNSLPAPQTHDVPDITVCDEIEAENLTSEFLDVREKIKNIWQQELGENNIKFDDDFFNLGGKSLTAVKIMFRIKQQLGRHLPIKSFFQNSTINKLSKLVINKNDVDFTDILVPLKAGGTKPPIYIVHGSGLNVMIFKSIAEFMDDNQPLYGLQALGLDGDTSLLNSVEQIAANYIDRILTEETSTKFSLVGYSLGGVIVYEMARQLKAKNIDIGSIIVLDTYVGNMIKINTISKLERKVLRQYRKLNHFFKNLKSFPKDTVKYQLYLIRKRFGNDNNQVISEDNVYDYNDNVVRLYHSTLCNYQMMPSDIKVNLFKVSKRIYFVDDNKYLGWNWFARKGVYIHVVPGDHRTFLLPPNNKNFAELLQKVISKNIQ